MGNMNNTDEVAYNVYKTRDYAKFKFLEDNRSITESRAKKILNSITKIGYIRNPITVNENYEILDGQGRFTVLKKLGKEIEYIMDEGKGIEEARQLNLGQTNWTIMDYVQSYAIGGNQNYALLLKLCTEFNKFSYQDIYGVLTNKIITSGSACTIKNGTMIITQEMYEKAVDTLTWLEDCTPEIDAIIGASRLKRTLFAWVYNLSDVDKDGLTTIVKEKYPLFKPMADTVVALADLSDIYNKKRKKRIYFENVYRESLYED